MVIGGRAIGALLCMLRNESYEYVVQVYMESDEKSGFGV